MDHTVDTEAGESVLFRDVFQASARSDPFEITISDRAVYLLAKRRLAVANPWYVRRIPIGQIRELTVTPIWSLWFLLPAVPMILIGGYATYAMLEPVLAGRGGTVTGVPIAVLVGGLLLPIAALGRRGLRIALTNSTFRWRPPMVFDQASKARIARLLAGTLSAANEAGIPTPPPRGLISTLKCNTERQRA